MVDVNIHICMKWKGERETRDGKGLVGLYVGNIKCG